MPWISDRLRAPDGCPWDREQTHRVAAQPPARGGVRGLRRARADGATPELAGELGDLLLQIVLHAQLAAEEGVFDLTDVWHGHRHQDRPPPPPRLRRGRGAHRVGREPPVGADQAGRAGRGRGRDGRRRRPRARSTASAARCRRSPPARRCRSAPRTSATTGRRSTASSTRSARRSGELVEAEDHAHRAEELGDLLFVLVNVGRKTGIEVEARAARAPTTSSAGGSATWSARPPRAASPSATAPSRSWTRSGTPPRRSSAGRQRHEHRQPAARPARRIGRGPTDDLRPVEITLGVQKWAEGSCLIRFGDTQVLCAATIEDRVPPHLRGKGTGWVTGTYEMLPRATAERSERESAKGKIGGRTHEIQRLVGRSLRGVVDLARLGERTVTVDCDVIVADGGTRTASITGGYVALAAALITYGMERHLVGHVAAVSVGIIDGVEPAGPRLLRGLARRGGLQRRRHGRRRATSSSRARPRASRSTAPSSTRCWTSPTRASAGCSRRRRRRSRRCAASGRRAGAGPAPPAGRHALAPQAARAGRAARPAARRGAALARRPGHRRRARRDRRDVRDQRADQGPLLRRAGPACPRSRTTPASRSTRSTAAPASGRAATPARTPPTRTNNAKLLRELAGLPPDRRGARYVCVLALALPGRRRAARRSPDRHPARDLPRAGSPPALRGDRRLRLRPDLRACPGAARRPDAGPVVRRREARHLAPLARRRTDAARSSWRSARPDEREGHIPPGPRGPARRRRGPRPALPRAGAVRDRRLRGRGRVLRPVGVPHHGAPDPRAAGHRARGLRGVLRAPRAAPAAGVRADADRDDRPVGRSCCRRSACPTSRATRSPRASTCRTCGSRSRPRTTWAPRSRRRRCSTSGRLASRSSSTSSGPRCSRSRLASPSGPDAATTGCGGSAITLASSSWRRSCSRSGSPARRSRGRSSRCRPAPGSSPSGACCRCPVGGDGWSRGGSAPWLGWAGVALIVASGFLLDDTTVFPGTAVLLPTMGSALVIAAGLRAARPGRWR